MRMVTVKVVCAATALLWVAALGHATGAQEETVSPELIEITAVRVLDPDAHPVHERLRSKAEEFGIRLMWEDISISVIAEKLGLLAAAGELPDLQIDGRSSHLEPLARRGLFQDVTQFVDQVPNWRSLFDDDRWDVLVNGYGIDGNVYQFFGTGSTWPRKYWVYRASAFDELGIEFPETTDELYDALMTIKEHDPDAVPLGTRGRGAAGWMRWMFYDTFRLFNAFEDPSITDDSFFDRDTGEYVPFWRASDKYRDMLIFLAQLYRDGLIDPEIATNTRTQNEARFARGQTYIWHTWPGRASWAEELQSEVDPDVRWEVSTTLINAYPDLPAFYSTGDGISHFGPAMAHSLTGEARDRFLELVDWGSTPEGRLWFDAGPDDLDWWYRTDDGTIRFRWEDDGLTPSEADDLARELGLHRWIAGSDLSSEAALQRNPSAAELTGRTEYETFPPVYIQLTDSEMRTIVEFSAIEDIAEEYYLQFLLGMLDVRDDSVWNRYIRDLNAAGLEEVSRIKTAAYERAYR